MDSDRAIARWGKTLQPAVALLFLAGSLLLSGCRGTTTPEELPAPARFVLAVGDRLVYDGWILNVLGFTVDSTWTTTTWDVLSTTASGGGYNDAVMIREQILRMRTNTATTDTFLLRLTQEGSVLRYGFLADLVRRREGRTIPRRWDTLAIPDVRSWTVGFLDSAGQLSESATVPADEDYFSVKVDSIPSIFAARRVEMNGQGLLYALWISTTPPCFPRLEEDPEPFNANPAGSLLLLRELRRAPR